MATEERVVAELSEIFNFTNLSDGRELLSRLEYQREDETTSYFTDFIKNLPVLRNFGAASTGVETTITLVKGPRRKVNNVLAEDKKSGAWANVRFGKNYVYKEVRVTAVQRQNLNMYYRDVLCEVLIQVILSCDPVHSDKVPKIINIFKRTPESESIWIQMEKMEQTFLDFITAPPPAQRPTFEILRSYFTDLCNTLEYLQTTYKFNHRDMKPDNLMIKEGKIKLIDFGYSIITFNGKNYSGTTSGGYSQYYFSKHIDLILMALFLRDKFTPNKEKPLAIVKYIAPPKASQNFIHFFINKVLTNRERTTITLTDYDITPGANTVEKKQIHLSKRILDYESRLASFKGRQQDWQIGYNWNGQYLDDQFEFPFATPMGFLDLYEKFVTGDPNYESFVESTLSKKTGGSTKKLKVRKNRRTRRY